MGFPRGVVSLSLDPAANRGTREDSSVFASGSVDSPKACLAQAAMVQLLSGVFSTARSPSTPRSFSPPAGEFHAPVLHNVQASCLDVVKDGYRGQGFSACAADFLP